MNPEMFKELLKPVEEKAKSLGYNTRYYSNSLFIAKPSTPAHIFFVRKENTGHSLEYSSGNYNYRKVLLADPKCIEVLVEALELRICEVESIR